MIKDGDTYFLRGADFNIEKEEFEQRSDLVIVGVGA
jgi:hypothetical protein